MNGSSGIAVGIATNIPPHNLTEVINGSLTPRKSKTSIDQLTQSISGPDFPTGGIIDGRWASMRPITLAGELFMSEPKLQLKKINQESITGNQ